MDEMLTLRGVVLSKYRTIGAFAQAMNWKRNKASRVLNDVQTLDLDEVQEVAECLNINSKEMFVQIFLPQMSTKWTNSQ